MMDMIMSAWLIKIFLSATAFRVFQYGGDGGGSHTHQGVAWVMSLGVWSINFTPWISRISKAKDVFLDILTFIAGY